MDKKKQQGIFQMANLLKKNGVLDGVQQFWSHEPGEDKHYKQPVVLRTTPVTWAIPFDEVCFSKAWKSQFMMRAMPWDAAMFCEHTYLAEARKTIHNQFIASHPTDWMLMLDSDVACPPDYIVRLLEHHKADPSRKCLAGWYRVKSEPFYPVVYNFKGDKNTTRNVPVSWWQHLEVSDMQGTELMEVDGAGAGAWLVHWDVLNKIGPDPFDMHSGGEDLQLCRLITEAGYKMFIDPTLKLAHVGVGVA